MKKIKKAVFFALLLCVLVTALTASAWAYNANSVSISSNAAAMYAGGTYTLTVTDTAEDGYPSNFTFNADHGSIVYVSPAGDGKSYNYSLSVNADASSLNVSFKNINNDVNNEGSASFTILAPTASATISGAYNSVRVGDSLNFSLMSAGSLTDIQWWTSTVDGGNGNIYSSGSGCTFTGSAAGQVYLHASAKNEIGAPVSSIAPVAITVQPPIVNVTGLTLNKNSVSLAEGAGETLYATIYPENATNKNVVWNTSDPSRVTVENGFIRRVGSGDAYITAASEENGAIYALCQVTEQLVDPKPKLLISETSATINSPKQLFVFCNGENATEVCEWTSSNPGVAYVSDTQGSKGLVTPAANGTTTISANYEIGSVKEVLTCTITVSGYTPATPTPTLSLDPTSVNLTVGATKQISARCEGGNCTSNCAWVSTNPAVATVSGGVVTAKSVGTTKITAMFNHDGKILSQDCYVTVAAPSIVHAITSGNYGTFDGKNPLTFTTNDSHYNFKGVYVDGYALTNGNQYLEQSSPNGYIQVLLNPAYMAYLSSANYHTIQIVSTSGTATGYFRTYGASYNVYGVRTGDESHVELWAALCVLSVMGAGAILVLRRKEIFGR